MQELQLFSQIAAAREHQVLSILAGVTEQQPRTLCEQHLIFAQTKLPPTNTSRREANNQAQVVPQRLNHNHLVRDVTVANESSVTWSKWRFHSEQTPLPGETDVISRTLIEHEATKVELDAFASPQWYTFTNQYTLSGHRFAYKNVIIRIYRVLTPHETQATNVIESPALDPKSMRAVDPSGSWIIECVVRVEDSGNSELISTAKRELLAFRDYMQGVLELFRPDRLALETRVKPS